MRLVRMVAVAWLLGLASAAHAAPVRVVAAENFYGDIARQVGGDAVTVESILTNPDQDPHQFEANASIARKLSDAQIVILNGLGYDPWVGKLLSASRSAQREVLDVGKLARRKDGDNPHLWYDVGAVVALAEALQQRLAAVDPQRKDAYAARADKLGRDLNLLRARIEALRKRFGGTPVTATEPVFGYMAEALGLTMRNLRFQLAQMNDTEPSASDIAAFEADLRSRKVHAVFHNTQTTEGLTTRLLSIAKAAGIPVVGVTETMPPGTTYVAWMNAQLDALEQALARK